ncbi:MAG: hypothetical protein RRY79_05445 [Clostridia bacterium]
MINEEIIAKTTEEATLRGLSSATEKEYQKSFRVFLRYYDSRSLEEMGESETANVP